MINVDEEVAFQAVQARALNGIAFQDDGGFVLAVHARRLQHAVGKGQRAVDDGHAVVQHGLGSFAHLAQDSAKGEHGTHRVAIGARVRGQQELAAPLDLAQDLGQHLNSSRRAYLRPGLTPSPRRLASVIRDRMDRIHVRFPRA